MSGFFRAVAEFGADLGSKAYNALKGTPQDKEIGFDKKIKLMVEGCNYAKQ